MVNVRYAKMSDLQDALDMWWELHLFHRDDLKAKKDFLYVRDVRARQRKHFSKTVIPKKNILLAEYEGRLAGFCEFQESSRPPIYQEPKILKIWAIYVRPGFRKKGIGKALLAKVDAIRKKLGIREMELSAHVRNSNALAFYRTLGFRQRMVELVK